MWLRLLLGMLVFGGLEVFMISRFHISGSAALRVRLPSLYEYDENENVLVTKLR